MMSNTISSVEVYNQKNNWCVKWFITFFYIKMIHGNQIFLIFLKQNLFSARTNAAKIISKAAMGTLNLP